MKKAVFIIGAPLVLLLVLVGVFWFYLGQQKSTLTKPPEHGVCFTIETGTPASESAKGIAELKDAIGKRFSRFGAGIFWEPVSEKQFQVYAPIVEPAAVEEAAALVSQRGLLELRLVHANSRDLIERGETPEGFELLKHKVSGPRNNLSYESCLVSRKAEGGPSGIHISQAMGNQASGSGAYDIWFKLTPDSAEAFKNVTRDNIGRQLAIVLDGMLLTAPVIRSEIAGGSGVISGDFNRVKAVQLASLLETPLPFPVKLLETKSF